MAELFCRVLGRPDVSRFSIFEIVGRLLDPLALALSSRWSILRCWRFRRGAPLVRSTFSTGHTRRDSAAPWVPQVQPAGCLNTSSATQTLNYARQPPEDHSLNPVRELIYGAGVRAYGNMQPCNRVEFEGHGESTPRFGSNQGYKKVFYLRFVVDNGVGHRRPFRTTAWYVGKR